MNDKPVILLHHTQIPDVYLDKVMRVLSPATFKVLMAISRFTFGWKKTEEQISFECLSEYTGLSKQGIMNSLEDLEASKIIIIERGDWKGHKRNIYKINFMWDGSTELTKSPERDPNLVKLSSTSLVQLSSTKKPVSRSTELNKIQTENIQTEQTSPNTSFSDDDMIISEDPFAGIDEKPDKPKKKPPSIPSRDAVRLTELLSTLIGQNIPNRTPPTKSQMAAWAAAADRLNRIDGHGWAEIEVLLRWCQTDSFWKQNILSMTKFREKWNRLQVKMITTKPVAENRYDRFVG